MNESLKEEELLATLHYIAAATKLIVHKDCSGIIS